MERTSIYLKCLSNSKVQLQNLRTPFHSKLVVFIASCPSKSDGLRKSSVEAVAADQKKEDFNQHVQYYLNRVTKLQC